MMKRLANVKTGLLSYMERDIWQVDLAALPWPRRFGVQFLQFISFVVSSTIDDHVFLRASSLTFTTLLAIVPLIGIVLAVLSGFHLEESINSLLGRISAGNAEVERVLLGLSHNTVAIIKETNFAAVGAISVVVIFGSIVSLMLSVENSFNIIFRAPRQRPFGAKLRDYTFIVIVTPLLLIIGLSLMAGLSDATVGAWLSRLDLVRHGFEAVLHPYPALNEAAGFWLVSMDQLAAFGFSTLRLSPLIVVWLLFTLLYVTLPYTPISLRAAFGGAVIAGTSWQFAYVGYLTFQFGLARYNKIYGSLASLPFFLMWLYVSWVIVLIGAEIVNATQALEGHRARRRLTKPSAASLERVALRMMVALAEKFEGGGGATRLSELARRLDLPEAFLQSVAQTLGAAQLIIIRRDEEDADWLVPARPTSNISVQHVLEAVRKNGQDVEFGESEPRLARFLAEWESRSGAVLCEISLAELVEGSAVQRLSGPAVVPGLPPPG
jgi:membrane protein